jgi:hypothetical protein
MYLTSVALLQSCYDLFSATVCEWEAWTMYNLVNVATFVSFLTVISLHNNVPKYSFRVPNSMRIYLYNK